MNKVESLEDEYMQIIKPYAKDEVNAFAKLFADLVMMLEPSPHDVLGDLYMELNLGNKNAGQFFTPAHISELMAQLVYGDQLEETFA
ncbi:SAM-dependent DNA methyltransferase [Bathymodiolus heckerae thiotrophic gill symbiont]|uniref:SAM-dependent DNA methyltransferase n=1 Tax=Bathymodiolus heckerae thiotrophic gill symbiont TaxID=1052212 RepID=UPI001BB17205|nr:SAM-dependent DNA methyltransferase [Bathymodiolus heckerae thiotrophic gill symbiont]